MPRRRAAPLALLLTLLALPLAACGDDSLTAEQLRTQASAICTKTAAATDRVPVPSTPAQGGRFLTQGLARLRPAVTRLRALKAPSDLRQRYDRAVQLAGREATLIARHKRAIAYGDDVIATFRRLETALEPLVQQENAYWRGLQIDACVRR
jgi:hypothetical protein